MVETGLKKNYNKWKHCMANFMQKRSAMLFDTMPCDRIYYYDDDANELLSAINVSKADVEAALHDTYYHASASTSVRPRYEPCSVSQF